MRIVVADGTKSNPVMINLLFEAVGVRVTDEPEYGASGTRADVEMVWMKWLLRFNFASTLIVIVDFAGSLRTLKVSFTIE